MNLINVKVKNLKKELEYNKSMGAIIITECDDYFIVTFPLVLSGQHYKVMQE